MCDYITKKRRFPVSNMSIEQDRSHDDPVKTEYGEDQGIALVEPDEEAVELRSTAHMRMAAKHSAAIFVGPSGERFRKKPEGLKRAAGYNGESQYFRSKRSRGTRFPLAELRGGSLLSGCWGEASGAGRGQGPAQLSVGNRHLVLGITCRQTSLFPWVQEAGATHDFQERSSCL